MQIEYWQKQNLESPLFPDLLWARPESRQHAGKLLIVGGNSHGFAAVQEAYKTALEAGAGVVRAVLPDALQKTVGPVIDTEFAPSTLSGSFAKNALAELLPHTQWSDAVLLAGDVGKNSETAALLEQFVQKYQGLLVITKDVIDYFNSQPQLIANRDQTTLVLSLAQLQKLGTALKFGTPFLLSMGMLLLVQALHEFTLTYPCVIVVKELDNIVVACGGMVTSTKLKKDKEIWRVSIAAKAATFWMQNPGKPLKAITSALL